MGDGLPEDQIQAILAANKSETIGNRNGKIPRNRKNEMQRNAAAGKNEMHDDDKDQELKLAKITHFKKMNPKEKTLTNNIFTITKRETRSMKRDAIKNTGKDTDTLNIESQKNETHAKITPRNKTSSNTNTDRTIDDDDTMDSDDDSDDVSDVFDTPLTLKHSSDDVIFNNIDDESYF